MASTLTATIGFPKIFSQFLEFLTQGPSFSANRAALTTTTDLTFSAFSLEFVDFAAQFCFRCKFLFHRERPAAIMVCNPRSATRPFISHMNVVPRSTKNTNSGTEN